MIGSLYGLLIAINWYCLAEKSVRKAKSTHWGHSCCENDTVLLGVPLISEWCGPGRLTATWSYRFTMSYPVDPAGSHMLVFKTKPCKSKYKQFIRRNCRWLIKTVIVYLMVSYYLDNRSNSRANTCTKAQLTTSCIY